MNLFKRLWHDQSGFINSAEMVLMATILVIGLIVGMVVLRNQIVQEFGDTASGVGALNQSYSVDEYSIEFQRENPDGTPMATLCVVTAAGSTFADLTDLCQGTDSATYGIGEHAVDSAGNPPNGMILSDSDIASNAGTAIENVPGED